MSEDGSAPVVSEERPSGSSGSMAGEDDGVPPPSPSSSDPSGTRDGERIASLDGVRGLAILAVLLWHYVACQWRTTPFTAPDAVTRLLSLSWGGVDLFFVLSGFLIVGILFDHRDSKGLLRAFFVRRCARILPPYALLILAYVVFRFVVQSDHPSLIDDRVPFVSYLTLTQNFFMHFGGFGPRFLGPTWSLAVEEQFYVVLPFVLLFVRGRSLVAVFLVAVMLAPCIRALVGVLGSYVFPFARADAVLGGGLLALALRYAPTRALLVEHRWLLTRALGIASIGLVALSTTKPGYGEPFPHLWLAVWAVLLLAVVAPPSETPSALERLLAGRVLSWCGTRSYAIYLAHVPVAEGVHALAGKRSASFDDAEGALLTLGALALVLALAELSHRLLEAPLMRLARRIPYESSDAARPRRETSARAP